MQILHAEARLGDVVFRGVAGGQHDQTRVERQPRNFRGGQQSVIEGIRGIAGRDHQGGFRHPGHVFLDQPVARKMDHVVFAERLCAKGRLGRVLAGEDVGAGGAEQRCRRFQFLRRLGQLGQLHRTARGRKTCLQPTRSQLREAGLIESRIANAEKRTRCRRAAEIGQRREVFARRDHARKTQIADEPARLGEVIAVARAQRRLGEQRAERHAHRKMARKRHRHMGARTHARVQPTEEEFSQVDRGRDGKLRV